MEAVRGLIGESAFFSWIDPLEYEGIEDGCVLLRARNDLSRSWVEANYLKVIQEALRSLDDSLSRIKIAVCPKAPQMTDLKADVLSEVKPAPSIRSRQKPINAPHRNVPFSYCKPGNLFSSFIEGPCNHAAFSGATAVASSIGKSQYNPLVIHGAPGMGKTHLLQAIAQHAIGNGYAGRVIYRSSDEFLKDFMRSVRERKPEYFQWTYENCDLLIVDDIQFLAKKERTQEELARLVSRLSAKNRQVVLSSDEHPTGIRGMCGRLLSRLESGVSIELGTSDLQTRMLILKARQGDLGLDAEVLRWIAMHFCTDIRQLE
ncbi:MAG TPA: DnaA/Hda family protein, partial [Fibrobacteraceae bacterium]|nr:DnaA/Hda family protein [Fibrobacteraceae bacterium]